MGQNFHICLMSGPRVPPLAVSPTVKRPFFVMTALSLFKKHNLDTKKGRHPQILEYVVSQFLVLLV